MDSRWDVFDSQKMSHDGSIDYEFQVLNTQGDVLKESNYEVYTTDKSAFFDPMSLALEVEHNTTLLDDSGVTGANDDESPLLASNGFLMFEDARYFVGNNLIQMVRKPGIHCHMDLITEASKEYLDTIASNAHIFVDGRSDTAVAGAQTQANLATDPAYVRRLARQVDQGNGYQRSFLPLHLIFESLKDDKVIQGSELRFILNKVSNFNEALYGSALSTDAKLNIKSIRLWGSKVKPSPELYANFLKKAKESSVVTRQMVVPELYFTSRLKITGGGTETYQVDANTSRPVKVVLGFQFTDRVTDPKLNPLEFDTLGANKESPNLSSVTLRVNGHRVPQARPYAPSIDGSSRIVQEIYRTAGMDQQTLGSSSITSENWLTQHSLFVFDLSNIQGSPFEKVERAQIEVEWGTSADVDRPYRVMVQVYSAKEYEYSYSTGTTLISLK